MCLFLFGKDDLIRRIGVGIDHGDAVGAGDTASVQTSHSALVSGREGSESYGVRNINGIAVKVTLQSDDIA